LIRTTVVAAVGATMVSSGAVAGYFDSNDGDTGGYLEVGYTQSSISSFKDKYKKTKSSLALESSSLWNTETFEGAKLQIGNDFGKVRLDLKVAAGRGGIDSIGGVAADQTGDEGAFAALSLNLYWDIYRLDLGQFGAKAGLFNAALTPYIGAGFGAAAVALKGEQSGIGAGTSNGKDHAISGGPMHHYTAGILVDVTESVGLTVAYDHTTVEGVGRRNVSGTDDHDNESVEVGLRYTF